MAEGDRSGGEGGGAGDPQVEGCPYNKAGLVSRLTLWWISKYLIKALKQPLTYKDIHQTQLPWVQTEKQVAQFSKLWPQIDERTGRPCSSLVFALVKHTWKEIVLTTVLAFICYGYLVSLSVVTIYHLTMPLDRSNVALEGIKFSYPVFIMYIMGYFEDPGVVGAGVAWGCAALMMFSTLLYGFLQINYTYINQVVSMQLRTTCSGLIYKKLLRINTKQDGSPTAGHITALLSTDVERFEKMLYSCQALLVAPVLFAAFILVEAQDFGLSIISGVAFIVGFELIRLAMGKLQGLTRQKSLRWTDRRVQLVNELFSAIRTVKMYCWEKPFTKKASKLRKQETKYLRYGIFLEAFGCSFNHSAGAIVTYFTVLTFIYSGHQLTPAIAVKLIGLVRFIEAMVFIAFPTSIASILETLVSVKRIERFLLSEEILKDEKDSTSIQNNPVSLRIKNITATWDKSANMTERSLTLNGINLTANKGELIAIIGAVGSGKTSLLMACLGELPLVQGEVYKAGTVAFVPQEAWIVPASIQTNVVLEAATLEVDRYHTALDVCQLKQDLDELPAGDQTAVGEKGLSLSGGQKARLNLARAVYSDADIYLLDNPLSAVDAKVASKIFERCICGALKDKVRILVTHNLEYLPGADRVIVIDKGRIVASGKYEDLSTQLRLTDYIRPETPPEYLSPATPPSEDRLNQAAEEDLGTLLADWDRRQREIMAGNLNGRGKGKRKKVNRTKKGDKEKLITDEKEAIIGKWSEREQKENGGVSGHVYQSYFREGRGLILGPLFIISLVLMATADILAEWWMANWSHDGELEGSFDNSSLVSNVSQTLPIHSTNQRVIVLSGFLITNIVMGVLQSVLLAFICINSSRAIYNSMFTRVIRAPMYFFERNSLGAVLNRFTRDTSFVDTKVPSILAVGCPAPILGIGLLVFTCVISPWATIAAIPLIIALPLICYHSMSGIRDLKRIEASLRSPTFTHLSATLQGLPVIRAFKLQDEFSQESSSRMDEHAMAWFLYLTAERFLSLTNFLCVTLFQAVTISIMLLLPQHAAEAGPKGLALTYIRFLIAYTRLSTMKFTSLETYMTSVERLLQYTTLPQEGATHTEVHPAPGWPRDGDIRLSNVCLQYRDSGRLALGPLSLHIHPGQKVAIVGRTGAGKSSLFACMLRMTDPTGSIRIDGLETTVLGLTDLRSNISVIPQDPILFSGPLRTNLDPLEEYSDDQLWHALGQVQMLGMVSGLTGGLYAETGEGGGNFSSGQKQLLCLARALLHNNKVIMFDEATSNVDHITESLIQEMLTRVLVKKTVLCIAHRLDTVISYDKVLVLDKGKRVQFDHPYTLLSDKSGLFYQMVHQSGDTMTNQLTERAHASFKSNKLRKRHISRDSDRESD